MSHDFRHIREFLDLVVNPFDGDGVKPFGGHISTGLSNLDLLLGGLTPGELVVVAGRTGVGKTALMLNFARNAAIGSNANVALFSLESSREQLFQRLLAAESRVDSMRQRLKMSSEIEEARLVHGRGILSQANICIDDSPTLAISDLSDRVMHLQEEGSIDLLVVDVLQSIQGKHGANRTQELDYIVRALKELARELDLPIVAGSQLSRPADGYSFRIPVLSDLRDSGSIEETADVVLFIYREDMHIRREDWEALHPDRINEPYPAGQAQIVVAKHRNGSTGVIHCQFHAQFSRFEDLQSVVRVGR